MSFPDQQVFDSIFRMTDSEVIIIYSNKIPKMQLFTGTSSKAERKSYELLWTEHVWEFQNNA